jgi:Gpi18-like mannosyltransferase
MISDFEKKIIRSILKKRHIIFVCIMTALFFVMRIILFNFKSADYTMYLLPWYEKISNLGKITALNRQIGDYSILYQFIISLLTYININPLYLYKIVSVFFDFVLAFFSAKLITSINNEITFSKPYILVMILPTVIFNSSMWAQSDSIYVSFLIISLWLLYKREYVFSFVFIGVAIACKFQAILLLPFYILVYLIRKDFSISYFLLSLISIYFCNLPGFIAGRSLLAPFEIYKNQTVEFKGLFFNLYNFSTLFFDATRSFSLNNYVMLRNWLILLTIIILLIGYYVFFDKLTDFTLTSAAFLEIATWSYWTCIMFLPEMHERYAYFVDIVLLLLSINNQKILPIAIVSVLGSFIGYLKFLLNINYGSSFKYLMAIAEFIVYIYFSQIVLSRKIERAKNE